MFVATVVTRRDDLDDDAFLYQQGQDAFVVLTDAATIRQFHLALRSRRDAHWWQMTRMDQFQLHAWGHKQPDFGTTATIVINPDPSTGVGFTMTVSDFIVKLERIFPELANRP